MHGTGVEVKFKGAFYQTFIHAAAVPELNKCEVTEEGLQVGAAVTLADLARELRRLINILPGIYTFCLMIALFNLGGFFCRSQN